MNDIKKQIILLEDKSYLRITGVDGVISLTETDASVLVGDEILEIKGQNLKCEKLSVELNELVLLGNIFYLKYQEKKEKKGFIKRIFK